jgi:hypothetical protein
MGVGCGLMAASSASRQADLVPHWWGARVEVTAFSTLLCLVVPAVLLFPTGRLPGPRWRWLLRATVLLAALLGVTVSRGSRGSRGSGGSWGSWEDDPAAASPWAAPATDADPAASTPWALEGPAGERLTDAVQTGFAGMLLFVLVAIASVLVRYCSAGLLERLQLEWFVLAVAVAGGSLLPELVDLRVGDSVWPVVNLLALALVPVAVGIALLRHRLLDIDRVISRTVSYGLLTSLLVAPYLLGITLLRALTTPGTESSDVEVVVSTLAVAALLGAARRRVQDAVDRRFDRARYDAARAVEEYSRRLRTQVDLQAVTAGLRETVSSTVGPQRLRVRLRDLDGRRP